MKLLVSAFCSLLLLPGGICRAGSAFEQLSSSGDIPVPDFPEPASAAPEGYLEASQSLPPDSDEPGFDWPARGGGMKGLEEETSFFLTANSPVTLMSSPWDASRPACELSPGAHYETTGEPSFIGEYVKVRLGSELPGCPVRGGFLPMAAVAATSAGGACELPRTVRAFLDTIAYAEGTGWHYNYIFTFATFDSYAEHPDRRICAGRLCSTAAGRYQFLTSTWKGLASALRLEDFSPPNQDRACLEIIRRAGAYKLVLNSGDRGNFSAALAKLNRIWASLPGSPYGQPTHSTAELWRVYQASHRKYP
ncbi:MAG TPA: hypothetical protein DDW67_05610 [Elusimicrobia bacterium]|nr:hypothetical protein [Elusimicrobiota bacterium]